MSFIIVKNGSWFYDNSAEKPVDVISLDYDFWCEIGKANDQLEPNEEPEPMNEKGVLYYYRFGRALETSEPTWVDSAGYRDLDEAMAKAQERAPSRIEWLAR